MFVFFRFLVASPAVTPEVRLRVMILLWGNRGPAYIPQSGGGMVICRVVTLGEDGACRHLCTEGRIGNSQIQAGARVGGGVPEGTPIERKTLRLSRMTLR